MNILDQLKKNYNSNIDNIPEKMRKEKRWIIFGTNEPKRENETLKEYFSRTKAKLPRQINFEMASCNDSSTWYTFEECLEASKKFRGFGGIGFQLGEDKESKSSFVCIDIDHCLNDGTLSQDNEKIEVVKDCLKLSTYNEISMSRTGLHFFLKGEVPRGINNSMIEAYDFGRYIAMTGELFQKQKEVKEDKKQLDSILKKYAPEEITQSLSKGRNEVKSLIDSISLDPSETMLQFYKEAIQKESDLLNKLFLDDYIAMTGRKARESCLNRYNPNKHPHQDKNPSMSYNTNHSESKYFCFSCQQAFGVVDFVMFDYNLEKKRDGIEKTTQIFKGNKKIYQYYDFRRQIQDKKKVLQERLQPKEEQPKIAENIQENIIVNEKTGEVVEVEEATLQKIDEIEVESSFVSNQMKSFIERTSSQIYEPEATSYSKLNNILGGGFTKQSIISIGGGTSTGKTTFTLEMIQEFLKDNVVIYYTLEMSEETIIAKLLSNYISKKSSGNYNFTINEILQGYKRTDKEREVIAKFTNDYSETLGRNLIVKYPEEATITEILSFADKVKKQTGKQPFIVVDYLQFLQGEPREEEASIIKKATRSLKKYTIENDSLAILLFANNREADNSKQATKISSGRSSSDIEFSSDYQLSIGFTEYERNENKKPEVNELKKNNPRRMTITIQKNRTGTTGEQIDFLFYPETNQFKEVQKGERKGFFQSFKSEDEEEEMFTNKEAILEI